MVRDDIVEQKKALRLEMKARRASLSESQRAQASRQLCQQLASWLESRKERTLGIYLARPDEISLDGLIPDLLRQGYTLAAPRVDLETQQMSFWRIRSMQEIETGPWNLRQPAPIELVERIPLIFVPGLAFDATGARLGTGGGWYDRTLTPTQTLAGLTFDGQIVPHVPTEAHDHRVNYVASEARWLEIPR